MILAIDTATGQASIAVLGNGGLLAELSWWSRGNHSRQLGALVPQLLELSGTEVGSLTGVAVAIGPGSFNGLRVGISMAKGLAFARKVPLAGIPTLDVIAVAAGGSRVCASLPAGRGEIYAAWYEGRKAGWSRTSDYLRLPLEEAAARYRDGEMLAGEGAEHLAEVLARRGLAPALQSEGAGLRRAGYLAELGRQYFDAHRADGLDDIQPLYLRRSAAEEKRAASQGE
jgi:tRNA threonylcarbamoyladenosine biosynthesis protein TsaB